MTNADVVRLARALKVLGETFNEPVSDVRAEAYFFALEEFSIDQVDQACRLAIRHNRFFPRPADLRELIVGRDDDVADAAWHELHAEFRRVGSWRAPQLSPTTTATVEALCGTWERACVLIGQADAGPELMGWQKRFRETYQVMAQRERTAMPPAPTRPQLVE